MFCKIVLRNFVKFAGKHLRQNLFFNKVADLMTATLLKRKALAQAFSCGFCEISKNTCFHRTPLVWLLLNISFLFTFYWKKTMNRVLYKTSWSLFLSLSSLKQLLWESLTDKFHFCFRQLGEAILFSSVSANRRLLKGCSTSRSMPLS